MNFMQNNTKIKNATDWPIRVALMFTPTPRSFVVRHTNQLEESSD